MLNYLGPNIGPQGPVTNVLPPAPPGTMPSGVPGLSPSGPPPMPAIQGRSGPPPSALAAIMNRMPSGPAAPEPPPLPSYMAETQEDGSVLLRVANLDGSAGPIVKVLPPMKALGEHPSNPKTQPK